MSLQLIRAEETSNFYQNADFPNILFVERTDKFTIDDIVFPDEIFLKGVIMTQMSNRWMKILEKSGVMQNTIIATDANSLLNMGVTEEFAGRMIAVQECIPIPLECIVRGYYVEESASWAPYKESSNMYGNVLPSNLKDSEQLPRPIYTPSIKGGVNEHDQNVSFAETIEVIKKFLVENFELESNERSYVQSLAFNIATTIRDAALKAYLFAHNFSMKRDIVIADAKLEFGILVDKTTQKRKLVLIDTAFTPDTCRFWDKRKYKVGVPQQSMDKQLLKRYAKHNLKWDGVSTPPSIPKDVLQKASEVYWDMYQKLFAEDFVTVTENLAWEWKFAKEEILI